MDWLRQRWMGLLGVIFGLGGLSLSLYHQPTVSKAAAQFASPAAAPSGTFPFPVYQDQMISYGPRPWADVTHPLYGAKGDGTTDDTASIQAAIATGYDVMFPSNYTFLITSTLSPQAGTKWMMARNTKILASPSFPVGSRIILIRNANDITFYGVKIDGNKASNANGQLIGVRIDGSSSGITIKNSSFVNCPADAGQGNFGDGIYIAPAVTGTGIVPTNITLDNVVSDANIRNALSLIGCKNVRIIGGKYSNSVGTTPGVGIDVESNDAADPTSEVKIIGADIVGNAGGGIAFAGALNSASNITVLGCNIETTVSTYGDGIPSSVQGVLISSNTGLGIVIEGNVIIGGYYGVQLSGGRGSRVSNNVIRDCRIGCKVGQSQTNVLCNFFKSCWQYSVFVSGGQSLQKIISNDSYNCGNTSDQYVYAIGDTLTGGEIALNSAFDDRSSPTGGQPTSLVRLPADQAVTWLTYGNRSRSANFTSMYTNQANFNLEGGLQEFTGAGNVTLSLTDAGVIVTKASGAATGVTLPAGAARGQVCVVKDGKGDANTNNITVTPASGNIDGAASKVINTAYGSMIFVRKGSEWGVLSGS